jgi:anaerobic selenocysteine-containing dehydrogenase
VRAFSRNGAIKAQIKTMDGVNPDTVWTWNAIGKRSGAWTLAPDAPEARKGFLLNHLISEHLPMEADGRRLSNSDPVTGQAAWFDLRVRIEKCEPGDETSEPQFATIPRPPGLDPAPSVNRYGAAFARRSR